MKYITVNFYLESNKNIKGKSAVYCYIRSNYKTFVINTGEKINPKYWDKKNQRAKSRGKGKYTYAIELNAILNKFESEIDRIIRGVKADKLNSSFDDYKEAILNYFDKKTNDKNFWDVYKEYLIYLERKNRYAKKYQTIKNLLAEFEKEKKYKISFKSINQTFYDELMNFLSDNKGFLDNTAYSYIKFFKTFMYWATKREYNSNLAFKRFEVKSVDNNVIFLTNDELQKLYNFDFSENPKLDRVRDCFIFQCLTGVRYSDLSRIDRNDIEGSVWFMRAKKTNRINNIPLNDNALAILAKYYDTEKTLPVISNQKMNKTIKKACELAGINKDVKIERVRKGQREVEIYKKYEVIGTHTARRTFVSLSLQKGMKPETIMKITGHSDYRMMKKYLELEDKAVNKEMREIWGEPLRQVK